MKRDKLLQLLSLCRPDAPSGKRVLEVASIYVQKGMIPARYIFDAYHIASASLGSYEALVSWNFEHIVGEDGEDVGRD